MQNNNGLTHWEFLSINKEPKICLYVLNEDQVSKSLPVLIVYCDMYEFLRIWSQGIVSCYSLSHYWPQTQPINACPAWMTTVMVTVQYIGNKCVLL